jgi:hypothetical protein
VNPSLDFAAYLATGWHLTPDFWLRIVVMAGLLMVGGRAGAQRYFPGQRAFLLLHAAMWL